MPTSSPARSSYLAVAFTALLTGQIAAEAGLRPEPFLAGIACAALGLGLSTLVVRETIGHAKHEGSPEKQGAELSDREVFGLTSVREPALSSASQAGVVNNLNDGLAWGLFPVLFLSAGLSVAQVGWLAALYPAVWGLGQLVTGALSDRWGRKRLITAGMLTQAGALAVTASSRGVAPWAAAAVLLGAGTAMVYPTLLAAIADVAEPAWRARAIGTYRLWRDGGFAVGAVLSGVLADAFSVRGAVWGVAALTAASGLLVAVRSTRPCLEAMFTHTRDQDRRRTRQKQTPPSARAPIAIKPASRHWRSQYCPAEWYVTSCW